MDSYVQTALIHQGYPLPFLQAFAQRRWTKSKPDKPDLTSDFYVSTCEF